MCELDLVMVSAATARARAANADLVVRCDDVSTGAASGLGAAGLPDGVLASIEDGHTLMIGPGSGRRVALHHLGPGSVRLTIADQGAGVEYLAFFVRQPNGRWAPFRDVVARAVGPRRVAPPSPPALQEKVDSADGPLGPSSQGAVFRVLPLHRAGDVLYLDDYVPAGSLARPGTLAWSESIRRLKSGDAEAVAFFRSRLDPLIAASAVLAVVPAHDPAEPDSGMRRVVQGLARGRRVDATGCLVRYAWIPKLSRGGDRDPQQHLASIRVERPDLVAGRAVLLLDDIVTTGCSFRACRELLLRAGAGAVECAALGRTARSDSAGMSARA